MRIATVVIAAVALVSAAGTASAQRDAGSKIRGTAYEGWSSGMSQDHAYDHAYILQNYATADEAVPREVARQHVAAVRGNLTAAGKSLDNLAKSAKDDATVARHVAAIKQHHAKAIAQCAVIDAACANGSGDAKAVHKCCTSAAESLKAAQDEHGKLMKHLKVERPDATPAGK